MQPPVDVEPWDGELDVSQEGRKCPQNGVDLTDADAEDCLTLDIYTHEVSHKKYTMLSLFFTFYFRLTST